MSPVVTFETPENIPVSYPLAGPGTRFIAFIFDMFIMIVSLAMVFLLATIVVLLLADTGGPVNLSGSVVMSALIVFAGFVYLGYFGMSEWLMNGMTIGKAAMRIRVVMADGFSLSLTGVLLRTLFRLIDVVPLLWVVPVVSVREQRFGDMAGGTIVISEMPLPMHTIRTRLAERPAAERKFAYSAAQVAMLIPAEAEAMEMFLERRHDMETGHRLQLAARLVDALSGKLALVDPVLPPDREPFLEDLLAAYAHKESREVA